MLFLLAYISWPIVFTCLLGAVVYDITPNCPTWPATLPPALGTYYGLTYTSQTYMPNTAWSWYFGDDWILFPKTGFCPYAAMHMVKASGSSRRMLRSSRSSTYRSSSSRSGSSSLKYFWNDCLHYSDLKVWQDIDASNKLLGYPTNMQDAATGTSTMYNLMLSGCVLSWVLLTISIVWVSIHPETGLVAQIISIATLFSLALAALIVSWNLDFQDPKAWSTSVFPGCTVTIVDGSIWGLLVYLVVSMGIYLAILIIGDICAHTCCKGVCQTNEDVVVSQPLEKEEPQIELSLLDDDLEEEGENLGGDATLQRKMKANFVVGATVLVNQNPLCAKQHKTTLFQKTVPPEYVSEVRCDICKRVSIQNDSHFYHCTPCGYDVCVHCGVSISTQLDG